MAMGSVSYLTANNTARTVTEAARIIAMALVGQTVNLKGEKDAEVKGGQTPSCKDLKKNGPGPPSESLAKAESDDPQKHSDCQSAFWTDPGVVISIFEEKTDAHEQHHDTDPIQPFASKLHL